MGHLPSIDLVRIQDGEVTAVAIEKAFVDKEQGQRSLGFRRLLSKFRDKVQASPTVTSDSPVKVLSQLPNMDLAINTKAEGRVLTPWEHFRSPGHMQRDASGT